MEIFSVASNEVIHLTPLIEDVHLSAVKRRDKLVLSFVAYDDAFSGLSY